MLLLRRSGPAHAPLPDVLALGAEGVLGRPGPGDPAETVAARARLASAVSTLSPAEHEVWHLRYVEDRPRVRPSGE
jgi:hypothetical protein